VPLWTPRQYKARYEPPIIQYITHFGLDRSLVDLPIVQDFGGNGGSQISQVGDKLISSFKNETEGSLKMQLIL
jgi:hypothetical protein